MAIPINEPPKDQNKDKGLWKNGNEYHEISQMDNDYLETAFYHCLKKIGSHSERIKKSISSLRKFEEKSREIYTEMKKRGIEDKVDDTPSEALHKALGEQIDINHGKETSRRSSL